MEDILLYISTYIPIIFAFLCEIGAFGILKKTIAQVRETNEFKMVLEQNKVLVEELKKANRLNKELLTKIDRIHRGEE